MHMRWTPLAAGLLASAAPIGAQTITIDNVTIIDVANGRPVAEHVQQSFADLPAVMARADQLGGQLDRAVIDLAEAAILSGREGDTFAAVVTDVDERGARMQLCDLPVVARVVAHGADPGQRLRVRLTAANPDQPPAAFQRVA